MTTERIICEVSDSNKTRVLYPPNSEHRIICGSDDHYATKLDMVALAETILEAVDTDMDKERQRICAIEERMADVVQRLRNLEHDANADVPMLRRMLLAQHKVNSDSIEQIVRLSNDLRERDTEIDALRRALKAANARTENLLKQKESAE